MMNKINLLKINIFTSYIIISILIYERIENSKLYSALIKELQLLKIENEQYKNILLVKEAEKTIQLNKNLDIMTIIKSYYIPEIIVGIFFIVAISCVVINNQDSLKSLFNSNKSDTVTPSGFTTDNFDYHVTKNANVKYSQTNLLNPKKTGELTEENLRKLQETFQNSPTSAPVSDNASIQCTTNLGDTFMKGENWVEIVSNPPTNEQIAKECACVLDAVITAVEKRDISSYFIESVRQKLIHDDVSTYLREDIHAKELLDEIRSEVMKRMELNSVPFDDTTLTDCIANCIADIYFHTQWNVFTFILEVSMVAVKSANEAPNPSMEIWDEIFELLIKNPELFF
jgi:hypothetical protein